MYNENPESPEANQGLDHLESLANAFDCDPEELQAQIQMSSQKLVELAIMKIANELKINDEDSKSAKREKNPELFDYNVFKKLEKKKEQSGN
jgi:hypothetical protein